MNGKSERILSLDVFRGLTMALMILVNSQGTPFPYPILEHATWDGFTLADLVFPSFLFIVGVTTVISLKRQIGLQGAARLNIYKGIVQRSILLFLFGLLLNAIPYHFDFASLRFYGILQRIAMCYFICAILYLHTSIRTQAVLFFGILVGYWYLMMRIPVPGMSGAPLGVTTNWVAYIDTMMFPAANLYKTFEPEGLLSTLPAVATTLSGLLTGSFLLTQWSKPKKCLLMIAAGCLFLVAGWYWGYNFPINKNLWSSTFVLWSSGISLIVFALCFYVIDVLGYSKWTFPFKVMGMNALFIFIFHVILLKIQAMFYLPLRDGTSGMLRVFIADYLFGPLGQENAALLYALVFLGLNFLVAAFLYRKKIFFKL